ncbi:hypothetical protein THRCLA_21658 [Thraustotheca clavata]|uniref:Crinkler effector protein N-terminal domain-containing protein n=1 Tax=Thraustotheca clavata TaxID=74557 RepID=A0A1V9ZRU7_9STRA|nr:hypothetical protein THRCLA_21658 [Thraustotheca clavata]
MTAASWTCRPSHGDFALRHVGKETPFVIEIAADKMVSSLKDTIKEEKKYEFPVDELDLYMVLLGLSRNAMKDRKLNEDGKLPRFKKMNDLMKIEKDYHFGMNFQPDEGRIYVLVGVPHKLPTTRKRSFEELGEIIEISMQKVLEERDGKKSVYSLSDMNSDMKYRILRKMNLDMNVLELKEPRDTSIPG